MKENKKNNELQSRRQFFKKAAKGALPILGAIAIAQMPLVTSASSSSDCNCYGGCRGTCYDACKGSCGTTCSGKCIGKCDGTCMNSCYKGNR